MRAAAAAVRQRRVSPLKPFESGDWHTPHAQFAIGGKPAREFELRRIFRQTRDANRLDDPLGKRLAKTAQIRFQPSHHDGL